MNWEHLLHRLSKAYYTEFVMQFTSLLVITAFLIKRNKSGSLYYLFILSFASLLQVMAIQYSDLTYNAPIERYVTLYSFYIYLIIELTCSLLFIRAQIHIVIARKILHSCIILFTIFSVLYAVFHYPSSNFPTQLLFIEGLLIIISALHFFYELFTRSPVENLFATDAFWAISGMLFLFTVISPIFLLSNYFRSKAKSLFFVLATISNIAYSLLSVTFFIAIILHKRQLSKKVSH